MNKKEKTQTTKKTSNRNKKQGLNTKTINKNPQNITPKLTFWHMILPPTLLTMITTAFYYPSLSYPFQFDDLANISKKFDIRFANPFSTWTYNRRWMGEWLNRLNFEIGRFDPFYYRLTNLLVHLLSGILLFFLILEGCRHLKKTNFLSRHALPIAFTTMALFLLHPVQTQAVSYVIQARLEGLATLFVLAALLTFLKAFQTGNSILKYLLATISIFIGFASCGTKEITIVTPLLALLLDWFFLAEEKWVGLKTRLWFHIVFSAVIFGMYLHYLSPQYVSDIATLKVTTTNNRGNIITPHAHDLIKPFQFLISEFKVVLHYLVMFLWPLSISVEYDWKLSENFFSPNSFFPFLILATLFAFAIYSLLKKKYSFFGFGMIWFFIAIAPRCSLIPSPELICDYKTYLASPGWLFILAIAISFIFNFVLTHIKNIPTWFYSNQTQLALTIILLLPIGYSSMNRNVVWSSSIEFWSDITKKAPLKARGHNNLGVALSEAGKFDKAIPRYLEAIRLDRFYSDPFSNLAVAYSVKGEIDKAIAALKQAIRIFPHYPEAYNNLGTLMLKKKDYDSAEKILNIALKLRPYYGKAFYNLGRLYAEKNDDEKSWYYFKKATEGDLDTAEGFFTLGQVSLKLKKYEEAIKAFETSMIRESTSSEIQRSQALFNLGNAYFLNKQYEKAQLTFQALRRAYPQDYRYLYNLAETFFAKGDLDSALQAFKQLKEPPFNIPQAYMRYVNCLEKQNKLPEAKQSLQALLSTNPPEQIKKLAQNELGRITIQERINTGNCTLTMKDLQQAFNVTTTVSN